MATGIWNYQRLNTQRVTFLINSAITNLTSQSSTLAFHAFRKLRKRLKQEDLAVVKAGKGDTLVLIDHSAYTQRVYEFLEFSNAVELKSFSLNQYFQYLCAFSNFIFFLRDSSRKEKRSIRNVLLYTMSLRPAENPQTLPYHSPGCCLLHESDFSTVKISCNWVPATH